VLLAGFEVPELGGLVHRAGGAEALVGVEGDGDDFVGVSREGVEEFSGVGIPEFGGGVEAAGEYFVAGWGVRYPKGTLKARA
jgi:hypothetical protein